MNPFPEALTQYNLSPKELRYTACMKLSDLEAIRLVISGDSVIDWYRLNFNCEDEMKWFLRVNGFDPEDIQDQKRIKRLIRQAIQYLDEFYPHRIPMELHDPVPTITQLLLWASGSGRLKKWKQPSCLILKIMHTINHMDARELLHRCQLPPTSLYKAVEEKVGQAITAMQEEEFHIVDFYGGRKDKFSIITKLLAKKENHAAAILDRVRFRIVTLSKYDILPVLYYLGRTICPFNYVIPNSSHNNLITFEELVSYFPHLKHYARYVRQVEAKSAPDQRMLENSFSSPEFKALNIVCDVPVRIDEFTYSPDFAELGRIVFVTVEFQLIDQLHYHLNEMGDGSHQKYKQRQLNAVSGRLRITLE